MDDAMITYGRQDIMLHQQIIQPGERLWTFCSLLQDYKLPFDLGHWQQPNTGCNIGTGSPLRIETFFFDRLEKTNGDDMSESTKHSSRTIKPVLSSMNLHQSQLCEQQYENHKTHGSSPAPLLIRPFKLMIAHQNSALTLYTLPNPLSIGVSNILTAVAPPPTS